MADCSMPVEQRRGKPIRPVSISERAGRREPSKPTSRQRQPPDVCPPQVEWGRAIQTMVSQNTEVEAYPLWNSQPVFVEERRDVLRTPCGEHESVSSVEDRLKCVQEVTRDVDQHQQQ